MAAALSHQVGDTLPANVHDRAVTTLGLRPRVRAVLTPVTAPSDVHIQDMRHTAVAGAKVLRVGVGIMDDNASNRFATADLSGGGGGGRRGGMKKIQNRRGSKNNGQKTRKTY